MRELALAARQDRVDADEPVTHGVLRDLLQVDVERRIHVDRTGHLVAVLQFLTDVIDEVRRLVLERPRRYLQRLAAGTGRRILADESRLRHFLEDDVATLL